MAARPNSYKKLIVYQKAKDLTIDLIHYCSTKKYPTPKNYLVNQLLRASSSVGANIAEGYGRYYKKSYRHFISIARGSSFEVDYWLEIFLELNKADKSLLNSYINRNVELMKILTTMMKKLEHST